MLFQIVKICVLGFLLSSCGLLKSNKEPVSLVAQVTDQEPVMRWDHRPEAALWTQTTLSALGTHGAAMLDVVPTDIDEYCPAYTNASVSGRAAFWAGIISALTKHESTFRPEASGGGGAWIGLTQIDPRTAKGYGCEAQSVSALKNGPANLSCAVRIMAHTVPRDGVVSRGMRGIAADWGPFHNSLKLADMKQWTKAQPYCTQ